MKKIALYSGTFLFFIFCLGSIFVVYNTLKKPLILESPVIIDIEKGDNDNTIFNKLYYHKIINFPQLHIFANKLLKKINNDIFFKSGEYQINSDESYITILDKMLQGITYKRRYTILEGQTTKEAIEILQKNPYLTGDITIDVKEGELFPETYFFNKGDSRNSQILIMKKKMKESLEEAWSKRKAKLPLKNINELLILASIVEKETGLIEERDHVAGVFINRLRKGMKLQSDPTVIYAITKGNYKLEKSLSKRNLRIKSPFNTYHVFGLPPTPIANPSLKAIIAASQPMNTKDLYFVADGNGGHRFARTLYQHNINVRKLRLYERNQRKKK